LPKGRCFSTDILSNIDRESVEERLMQTLDTLNIEEQTIDIDEDCALEIKEYLALLDLIMRIDEESLPAVNSSNKNSARCEIFTGYKACKFNYSR